MWATISIVHMDSKDDLLNYEKSRNILLVADLCNHACYILDYSTLQKRVGYVNLTWVV